MSSHAIFGASSMHRWKPDACPGSIQRCNGEQGETSEFAEEGTLAHDLAAKVLMGGQWPKDMDPEMRDHLRVYTHEVARLRKKGMDGPEWIEQRVDLSSVVPGCFGTVDYGKYVPKERTLYVRDLKYGAGILVEVEENVQLLYYATGLWLAAGEQGLKVSTVDIGIVQPRAPHPDGPVRSHQYPVDRLFDFCDELEEAVELAKKPDAPIRPGDWCRFCPANYRCPDLEKQSTDLVNQAFDMAAPFDADRTAEVLDKVAVVEGWCKSFREYAYRQAMGGNIPTGYKMVAKRATRKWKPGVTVDTICKEFRKHLNDVADIKLRSPAQVEKEVCTKHTPKNTKERLAEFYVKESSGLKLVQDSDPGAPVEVGVEQHFDNLDESDGDLMG